METLQGAQLFRAAAAVSRRIWITYIRYPSWTISLLIWPILFPFGYIFACRALAGPDNTALGTFASLAGTADYVGFIAIGITIWQWFNLILWGLGASLRSEQMRGTLESNWLAPVPKIFLLLGASWADILMGLVMLSASSLTLYIFYGVRLLGSFWHLALVVLASIPSIYGIGVIFASLVLIIKETNAFVFFVRGIMTVFCGITYPIAILPDWMAVIARTLPLTHSINAVRAIVSGSTLNAVGAEMRYLLISGAILVIAAYLTFLGVQRRMLASGTIGQY